MIDGEPAFTSSRSKMIHIPCTRELFEFRFERAQTIAQLQELLSKQKRIRNGDIFIVSANGVRTFWEKCVIEEFGVQPGVTVGGRQARHSSTVSLRRLQKVPKSAGRPQKTEWRWGQKDSPGYSPDKVACVKFHNLKVQVTVTQKVSLKSEPLSPENSPTTSVVEPTFSETQQRPHQSISTNDTVESLEIVSPTASPSPAVPENEHEDNEQEKEKSSMVKDDVTFELPGEAMSLTEEVSDTTCDSTEQVTTIGNEQSEAGISNLESSNMSLSDENMTVTSHVTQEFLDSLNAENEHDGELLAHTEELRNNDKPLSEPRPISGDTVVVVNTQRLINIVKTNHHRLRQRVRKLKTFLVNHRFFSLV